MSDQFMFDQCDEELSTDRTIFFCRREVSGGVWLVTMEYRFLVSSPLLWKVPCIFPFSNVSSQTVQKKAPLPSHFSPTKVWSPRFGIDFAPQLISETIKPKNSSDW